MTSSAIGQARDLLTDLVPAGDGPRAIRHPLGFYCIPVVRDGPHGVCVHVWDGECDSSGAPPHSHSWELTSHVLHGTVDNRRIAVTDDPVAPTNRVYAVDSAGDVDRLRATTRLVRWAETEQTTVTAGGVYRLAAGQFHTTVVPAGVQAASLVVARTMTDARDLVVGTVADSSHEMVRHRCDADETAALARLVLGWLGSTARSAR